ncbi:MAG: hypothetical protein HYZ26_04665 [Chloroflexi bacterium]|nr:hypothetical protein [Chloroflexota bacterium]
MLLVLAILFLLATPLTILGLRRARGRMGAQWLLAALGALLAWASLWFLRPRLPLSLQLLDWGAAGAFPESPALLADDISWPFTLALATLALAVILTAIGRLEDLEAGAWTGSLAVSALGIAAVLAGNPLTLALAWTALDILELVLLLPRAGEPHQRRSVVTYFATSISGTFLLLYADTLARASGELLVFEHIPAAAGPTLFLAVALRLGVLPVHLPFIREPDLRRGLGTIIRLASPAASLTLLVRAAAGGITFQSEWLLLALVGLAALYAAAAWARVPDELVGRPSWILGMSALAFAAALGNQPEAVLAWSLAALLGGGVLFLSARPGRARRLMGGLGAAAMLGLPFTPTAAAMHIYQPVTIFTPLFLLAHALLVYGYVRHLDRPLEPVETPAERWIQVVAPGGLALVLLGFLAAGLPWLGAAAPRWPPVGIALLAGGTALLGRRIRLPGFVFAALDSAFSLRWLFSLAGRLLERLSSGLDGLNRVLEGEGGVLWALVLVALLISLLGQLAGGG